MRIVSEIGDELISSDHIALYELIKNTYDAQASCVRVSVQTPVGLAELEAAQSLHDTQGGSHCPSGRVGNFRARIDIALLKPGSRGRSVWSPDSADGRAEVPT